MNSQFEGDLSYQEKVCQAVIEDHTHAEQMADVLKPEFFGFKHLQVVCRSLYEYRDRYRLFPSWDILLMQVRKSHEDDRALGLMLDTFSTRIREIPLGGDAPWVKETSLEFCRRQNLYVAIETALVQIENKKYDAIAGTIRNALDQGSPKDLGHDYIDCLELRSERQVEERITTGHPVLDRYMNGGQKRGTIVTYIAPTGAGKTMFLTNSICAAVAAGYNGLYVTLEMEDREIGIRADSWFSGLPMDDLPHNIQAVRQAIADNVKGRFIIKQYPTKKASVETIRTYLQRALQQGIVFDVLVVDYPDLLKPVRHYGEKRDELASNYEELRGLASEFKLAVIVADQTNRSGLDHEIVSVSDVAEAYSKMTVCDGIFTVARTSAMKVSGTGNFHIAKNRMGRDGIVLPFMLDTFKNTRIRILDNDDVTGEMAKMIAKEEMGNITRDRINKFKTRKMSSITENV